MVKCIWNFEPKTLAELTLWVKVVQFLLADNFTPNSSSWVYFTCK